MSLLALAVVSRPGRHGCELYRHSVRGQVDGVPWRDLWPVSPREFAGTAAAAEATANIAKALINSLIAVTT